MFSSFLEDYKTRYTKFMDSVLQKTCKLRGIQNELTDKFDPADSKVAECSPQRPSWNMIEFDLMAISFTY